MKSLLYLFALILMQSGAEGQAAAFEVFSDADGSSPIAPLGKRSGGNFYGTTWNGGTGAGDIYQLTPAGSYTLLHSFSAFQGAQPESGLVEGSDGSFYGTTFMGGAANRGTVYKVTPEGAHTLLHSFASSPGGTSEGQSPISGLAETADGTFYGTTFMGGASQGTIYRVTSGGVFTSLHSFTGALARPRSTPIFDSDGKLYGTALGGSGSSQSPPHRLSPSANPCRLRTSALPAPPSMERCILTWSRPRQSLSTASPAASANRRPSP